MQLLGKGGGLFQQAGNAATLEDDNAGAAGSCCDQLCQMGERESQAKLTLTV